MINIEDYKEVFSRYENANHALEDFADFFVKEEMAGSTFIHRNAAIKRIAAPVIFTALFTGTVIFHLYYHIWPLLIFIEVLAIIIVSGVYATRFFTTGRVLRQKIQAQPDREINEILLSEKEHFWSKGVVRCAYGVIFTCALLLILTIFRTPRMVFKKCDDGYILSNYSLSFSSSPSVVIPDTWEGEPVTEIRSGTFYEMRSIKSIKLPKGITKIQRRTFERCVYIRSIDIPEGVTEIEEFAFQDCHALENVTFPSTLKAIDSSAFIGCHWLEEITVPKGCKVDEKEPKEMKITVHYK